jgi:hypothetical protein
MAKVIANSQGKVLTQGGKLFLANEGGTIDNEVTKDSANAVKSSGIYNALGKYGVISQTQTWARESDYSYSYVMSAQVWGLIPDYFITMWKLRGGSTATFNETTGYFEYLDLTDISYEEAQAIYSQTADTPDNELYTKTTARAVLPFLYGSHFVAAPSYGLFSNANWLESVTMGDILGHNITKLNSASYTFYAARLRKVFGIVDWSSLTSTVNPFGGAFSLEDIQLKGLKASVSLIASAHLTAASVAYMINNAGTATFTITLHATAYARATADADVQAALAAHTNVTLASN